MNVLKLSFGATGKKTDSYGMRFYGHIDSRLGLIGDLSEMIPDPDVPPMIKRKRVTLWFNYEKIQPYKEISNLLDNLKLQQGMKGIRSSFHRLISLWIRLHLNT